jgi:hypothetical protein
MIGTDGKVNLVGDGWLVLGESFSPGWRAWCSDRSGRERELGAPQQIDGFANGWRINGSECASARFEFGPQRFADLGYWISGLAGLALLAFILIGVWRRRGTELNASLERQDDGKRAIDLTTDSGVELTVAPRPESSGAALQDSRGPRLSGWLFAASALSVAIVGLLYVIKPATSAQGINFDYPLDHVAEHWVALAAMISLVAGAALDILARRRRSPNSG